MPKANTTGGKRYKKCKKHRANSNENNTKLTYKNNEQIYATIKKKVGGPRVEVECSDGKIKHAIIPGKFRKRRVPIEIGDIVLCNIPAITSDTILYIAYKYNNNEINQLKNEGHINFDVTVDDDAIKFINTDKIIQNNNVMLCNCGSCYNCIGSLDSSLESLSESKSESELEFEKKIKDNNNDEVNNLDIDNL